MKTKLLLIFLSFSYSVKAKVFNSVSDGDWSNQSVWGDVSVPNLWDTVNIYHNIIWNPQPNLLWKGDINVLGSLVINTNKLFYWRTTLKVDGKLTVNGRIVMSDIAKLLINNPDSIKIRHLQSGYAILTNLSSDCGSVIIDSITTNANAFFNGMGVYLTQFTDINEHTHFEIDSNRFLQQCDFTYIYEPKKVMKERDFLNFDILGRKIK